MACQPVSGYFMLCGTRIMFIVHLYLYLSSSLRNFLYTVIRYEVFLSNTNNLNTVIRYQVFLSNTNNLHTVVWFHIYLSNTNNYYIFCPKLLHTCQFQMLI